MVTVGNGISDSSVASFLNSTMTGLSDQDVHTHTIEMMHNVNDEIIAKIHHNLFKIKRHLLQKVKKKTPFIVTWIPFAPVQSSFGDVSHTMNCAYFAEFRKIFKHAFHFHFNRFFFVISIFISFCDFTRKNVWVRNGSTFSIQESQRKTNQK